MNAADQSQPLPWKAVSEHPDFQNADWQTRQKMRNNYMDRVVRPLAKSEEDFARVRDRFFTETEQDVFSGDDPANRDIGEPKQAAQEIKPEDAGLIMPDTSQRPKPQGGLAMMQAPIKDKQQPRPSKPNVDEALKNQPKTVSGWAENVVRGGAEGAVGSFGAMIEGIGIMIERAGQVKADRKVDGAIQRLETTRQQYASALEGTSDEFRADVEENYESLIEDRSGELKQALIDWEERESGAAASWMRDMGVNLSELGQSIGPDENYRGVATDLAGGVGSMLTYLGPGMIVGALTRGSIAAVMATSLGMATPSGVSETYNRAIQYGLGEEEALERSMAGAIPGAIQVAPLASILKPIPRELRGKAIGQLTSILRTGGSEATVEGAGAVLQNLIEQAYNPEKGTWDDVAYNAAIGSGAGAVTQGATQIATRGQGLGGLSKKDQIAEELEKAVDGAEWANSSENVARGLLDPSNAQLERADSQEGQFTPEQDAEFENAWRQHERDNNLDPVDDLTNPTGLEIPITGRQDVTDAERQEAEKPTPARGAPQEDDTGARLIRSPTEQLDPMEQRARERLLTGDGYAFLRERAEGNDAAVAAVDRMQVLANEGNADGAADAYKEARQLLQPEEPVTRAPQTEAPQSERQAQEQPAPLPGQEIAQEAPQVAPAQPAAEPALAPDQPSPNPDTKTPRRVPVESIQVDPEAYQFRTEVNEQGVDSRLEGIKKWDDLRAGNLILHERTDGSVYAADGHHRINLARQIEQPDVNAIVLREADGVTVEGARRAAAEANIAAGSATAMDAAKVFRNSEGDINTVIRESNLPRTQLVRDGADIAKLDTEPFGAVLNRVITEKDGAVIGRSFADPDQQLAAVGVFQRVKPTNDNQRELLANEVRQAGFAESQGEQGGLFGDDPAESLIGERVKVMDNLRQTLVRDKRLFATLNDNAQTAEQAGNRIAKDRNNALQETSADAIALLERATTTPEINQQINDAARRVKDGETLASVTRELKEALLNGTDSPAASEGRTPAPSSGQTDQAGQDAGRGEPVPANNDARAKGAGEQRGRTGTGTQEPQVKADGKPFQTRRQVELSQRFRNTPNAQPVEVEGGWGFTAPAQNAESMQNDAKSTQDTGVAITQDDIRAMRDEIDNAAPETREADAQPQEPATTTETSEQIRARDAADAAVNRAESMRNLARETRFQADGKRLNDLALALTNHAIENGRRLNDTERAAFRDQYSVDDGIIDMLSQQPYGIEGLLERRMQGDLGSSEILRRAMEHDQQAESQAPDLTLETQTEESLAEQARQQQEAEAAEQARIRKEEQRAQADAEVDDFTLAGSNSAADLAAAQGQSDLLGAQPETTPTQNAESLQNDAESNAESTQQAEQPTGPQPVTLANAEDSLALPNWRGQLQKARKFLRDLKANGHMQDIQESGTNLESLVEQIDTRLSNVTPEQAFGDVLNDLESTKDLSGSQQRQSNHEANTLKIADALDKATGTMVASNRFLRDIDSQFEGERAQAIQRARQELGVNNREVDQQYLDGQMSDAQYLESKGVTFDDNFDAVDMLREARENAEPTNYQQTIEDLRAALEKMVADGEIARKRRTKGGPQQDTKAVAAAKATLEGLPGKSARAENPVDNNYASQPPISIKNRFKARFADTATGRQELDMRAQAERQAVVDYVNQRADTPQQNVVSSGNALADEMAGMTNAELEAMIDDVAEEAAAPQTEKPKTKRKKTATTSTGKKKPRAVRSKAERADENSPDSVDQTAGDIAGNIGVNLSSGGKSAVKGLTELFGGKGTLNSGLSFDEQTYAKAKPHFIQMFKDFQAAGKDLRDLIKAILNNFGTGVKPYILRFAQDVRAGNVDLQTEGETDVSGAGNRTESNTGNVSADNSMGGIAIQAGSGRTQSDAGAAGEHAGSGGRRGQGNTSLSEDGAGTGRAGSDNGVYQGNGEYGASVSASGGRNGGRGRNDGDGGIPTDTRASENVVEHAEAIADGISDTPADTGKPTPYNLGDIKRQVPQLMDEQAKDVQFAERRFYEANARGVMFTNGTGTGKTYTGLGVAKRHEVMGKDNILIVVPNDKIASDWVDSGRNVSLEINKLRDTKDNGSKGPVITTYANFRQNQSLVRREWDLIVADESHNLMQADDFAETAALKQFRLLTHYPGRSNERDEALNPESWAEYRSLVSDIERAKNEEADNRTDIFARAAKAKQRLPAVRETLEKRLERQQKRDEQRWQDAETHVTFLSATPFAYRKTIDYANGFLFDYGDGAKGKEVRAYNEGSDREQFFVRNFGYRMRYNKLNDPDAQVDVDLMEREFNQQLKNAGAVRSRMLEVDQDYDRRFQLVQDAIGTRIDEGLEWLSEKSSEARRVVFEATSNAQKPTQEQIYQEKLWSKLDSLISDQFDYLSRSYLLEAIKAKNAVPYIQQHLDAGRKAVVFHNFNKGGGFHPFKLSNGAKVALREDGIRPEDAEGALERERPDLVNLDLSGLKSPIATLNQAFGSRMVQFNGTIPKAERNKNTNLFNQDDSGVDVILVQADAGGAGISLHDTTGNRPRMLLNLGLPVRPTAEIQIEGRIYRVGVQTDAMMRLMSTGLSMERSMVASKLAERSGTAENLAMGNLARALKDNIIEAYQDADNFPPGFEGEGKGGKELDRTAADLTDFQRAKSFYFANKKRTKGNKSQEGVDYFATPEPVGLKMVEWLDVKANDDVLEPSAGHGAIARWIPELATAHLVEPSYELASRLRLAANGQKVYESRFEDLAKSNKYDSIAMNPPFGRGGKTAFDHLDKAFSTHLRPGGRVVALVPTGPAADKRFDKWLDETENVSIAADVKLPTSTFERAGTSVSARILVIDKIAEGQETVNSRNVDLRNAENINELFDRIENIDVKRSRVEPEQPAETEVTTVGSDSINFNLAETTHAKKGIDLYVASIAERVDYETYKRLNAIAKQNGGYYSKFNRNGAIPGFQFESPEQRQSFVDAALGAEPDDTRYSLSEGEKLTTPPTTAEVTEGVASMRQALGAFNVVESHTDLPAATLQKMARRGVNPADVRGFYEGDQLTIIAGNNASVDEAVRTALHEAVGHKGMRAVLGEGLAPVMRQLFKRLPQTKIGREARKEVLRDYPFLDPNNANDQAVIGEEMVANLIEKGHRPTHWQRAVAQIKALLRRAFPFVPWTTTDALELSEKSRDYLRRQQSVNDGTATDDMTFAMRRRDQSRISDLFSDLDANRPNTEKEGAPTADNVKAAIKGIGGVGSPVVLDSADNLALDIALESTIAGVNPQDAIAFYHGDDLYVIASNARDTAEAVRATLTTAVARQGMRNTLGSRVDTVLNSVVDQAQKNKEGRKAIRAITAEFDHLTTKHQPDKINIGAEIVARFNALPASPAFTSNAADALDRMLQAAYQDAGFVTGDGAAMAQHNQHYLQQQQRNFGKGQKPYQLPYVFTVQDGPGRGTLLDMNPQVVDIDGNIVSDAAVDSFFTSSLKGGQGFFESTTDRLRRSNSPVLQELAKRVDAYFDQAEARLGMVNGILREPLKRLRTLNPFERSRNMRDFESYMRHRDNGRTAEAQAIAERNEAVAELAEAVDTMFDQVGALNQTVKTPQGQGMRVFDSKRGVYRKIGKIRKGEFWPRAIRPEVQRVMHDPTSNNALWHELLDALVDEGHAATRREAAEYLRGNKGYFSNEITNDYFAGIEKARGEKLPEIFYDYRFDVVSNYARKWSSRISQVEQFGQKVSPNSKDAFEEAASVSRDEKTRKYIGWIADRAYGRTPTDGFHNAMGIANLAATGLQLGNPGTATLNLVGGTQLNIQMFGSKRMARAYAELATDAKAVFREGVELGILGKDVLNILRDADNRDAAYMDANSRTKEALSKFSAFTLKWGGYTGTEQVIRATGMIAARAQLMDALHAWNNRPYSKDAIAYRKFMQRNRIDQSKLLRENGKGEETARYLRLMVNIPQGSYRVDQTPGYVDTPMGRFFFKYQKFGTQVSRMFWQQKLKPFMSAVQDQDATGLDRAKAFLPILQWMGWSIVGGGAILSARGAMFGYMDPGPDLEEIAKAFEDDEVAGAWGLLASKMQANMIAGSAYGLFGNYIQMGKDITDQQRVKNPFEPPGLAPADAGVELVRRWLEQGHKLYATDFEQVAERQLSLYRTSKRGLAAMGNQSGVDADFVRQDQARRDFLYIRKAARRFADEAGIDATRTSTGRFGLTERTAANRKIVDAIRIGDGRTAYELVEDELDKTENRDEMLRLRQSMRSTVRARHPVQIGGPASQEEIDMFLEWAEKSLPKSKARLVIDTVERYEAATRYAGL